MPCNPAFTSLNVHPKELQQYRRPPMCLHCDFKFLFYFVCVSVLAACLSVCHVHTWNLWWAEEGDGSPGTRVTDSCRLPCGCTYMGLTDIQCQPLLFLTHAFGC